MAPFLFTGLVLLGVSAPSPFDGFWFQISLMIKLCIIAGGTVGGFVGYIVPSSWGIMWAFFISSIGSLVGVYYGWKLGRHLDR
jgi:hypothetical protein